ncbi:MAG: CHAT domain-containing protein [Aulosira sp. ZfuVER01]|nr:CHAT domain-containing tetratricopeptide repeat protein [Aulosira sp. ZfuVER01]MDZ7998957.1 CHAT domain-containing tetratricopeptide repeat protein [Aulosira sp. DedVER01a]MDZ8053697.1 CHAT domain-containing tetratricopeptide repeat protein [Aulosira sp. ZfuCHP01]
MLKRLWRWFKELIQQLFGRKKNVSPPLAAQETGEIRRQLTDTEYQSLFLQLLAGVNDQDWSRGRVKGFLDSKRINQANLVEWLRGFGERLLASAIANDELAQAMVRLGELAVGDVSVIADDIGRRLLKREEEINRQDAKDSKEGKIGEEVIVTSDELLVMMQQDVNLVQQIAQQLGIETSDPQVIMKALMNQVAGDELTNADTQPYVIRRLKNNDALAYFFQGFQQYQAGDCKEAVTSFEKAIESKLNFQYLPDAWFFKAEALISLGLIEEAVASCEEAIRIKPDYYQGWNWLGSVQCDYLQQYEKAVISFDKAIKLKSDFCEAWINRAEALNNSRRYEEALASCNEALKLECEFEKYYETWNKRGIALRGLNRDEEAIASYDKTLEIKLDYHHPWQNRAFAAMDSIICDPLLSSLSAIAKQNPALNQRGYNGALASFEEGLKYCQQDTHPEGWGILNQQMGNTHYLRGRGDSHPRNYWYKAVKSYNEALKTLTAEDFPELHLDILRDLIRVQLDLGETAKAEEIERRGTDVLQRLLDECKSPTKKKQLALKFAGFQQFTVDLAVQSGNWCAALELAEQGKNACLSWLLDGWSDDSPKWLEMKQLLNPNTAIVYWHLSPAALHTFIVKHNAPSPIVLAETLLSPVQRLRDFESWVKNWNQEYANYHKGKGKQSEDAKTWRDKLPTILDELGNILDINAVVSQISDITQLILIPHRDLHRFPLQALFPPEFTISYLPSAQIGINLQKLRQTNLGKIHELPLLSVEYPNSKDLPQLPHAVLESAVITQLFNNPKTLQISGKDATNTAVKASLKDGYNVFHFTGHSTYNFHNPKESALALSGEDFLTLEEICNIENLSTYQLVSLSSCETAITGNQTITAEYAGLVSAFLAQGVTDVVSTLWSVTDEASSFLMIYFYWQIKKGKSPVIALNRAAKWLRNLTFRKLERIYRVIFAKLPSDETVIRPFIRRKLNQISAMEVSSKKQKRFEHPYYWAGFIITGGLN